MQNQVILRDSSGGNSDDTVGYFVEPTIVTTTAI